MIFYLFMSEDLNVKTKAYYETSPDNKYIAALVYFEKKPFFYSMVLDENKKVIFVSKGGRDDVSPRLYTWGYNNENEKYVSMLYGQEIILPPSILEKLYALMFVKIKGFDIGNAKMITERKFNNSW